MVYELAFRRWAVSRHVHLLRARGAKFDFQEYFPTEVSQSVRDVFHESLEKLQQLGATLISISLPSTQYALSAYYVLASAEASSNMARYDGIEYGKYL